MRSPHVGCQRRHLRGSIEPRQVHLERQYPPHGQETPGSDNWGSIPLVKEAKDLGAPSTGGGARRTAITRERLQNAADRARRLRHLPGAGTKAQKLSATLVTPATLYGAPHTGHKPD